MPMLKSLAPVPKISMEARHESILMSEVLTALDIQPSDTVVDATIGGAGHFSALLAALGEGGVIVGIDADPAAVERGREAYARDRRQERPVAHLVNDNFRNLARILERLDIGRVDKILFDLGWSGYQIAAPRGFSFSSPDEPLLMSYAESSQGKRRPVSSTVSPSKNLPTLSSSMAKNASRAVSRVPSLKHGQRNGC